MGKRIYTLLLIIGFVLSAKAQGRLDFIDEAQKVLQTPTAGVTGGPNGSGSGVVGAIGGVVDVGGLGAATYSIPLELPEGIKGIQPNLSITYNSQSGNGLLGWGWTLGGLSAISRVAENLFLDNRKKGVNFDKDRFALDGHRLIANDGIYGNNLAEYRTEVDGMSKIVSYTEDTIVNGPAKFKVWTSDGLVMEYGFTPDSKIAYKISNDAKEYEVALWLLSKVQDREGNYMTFEYGKGGAHYCVKKISYTGNANANLYPRYVLTFEYESDRRRDEETTFVGNRTLHQSKILKSVSINWQVYNPWGLEETARYDFGYYSGDAQSGLHYHRLKDIAYTRGGASYNKTVVEWGANDYSTNPSNLIVPVSTGSGNAFNNKVKYSGDFNGDGFKDIIIVYEKDAKKKKKFASVYLNDGLSNGRSSFHFLQEIELDIHTESLYVADLNGDGRDDMVTVSRWPSGLSTKKVKIFPFLTKWTSSGEWKLAYAEKTWNEDDLYIGKGFAANLMIGDFLGNGKTDMVMQIPDGYTTVPKLLYITHEGGNRFAMKRTDRLVLPGETFVAADFNGDGITEIWCDGNSKGYDETGELDPEVRSDAVLYRMTSKTTAMQFSTNYMLSNRHHISLGDFNGDGKCDMLSYVEESKNDGSGRKTYRWQINYFKETELHWPVFDITDELPDIDPEKHAFGMFDSPSDHRDYQYFEVTDMDGDGKSDFVVAKGNKLYVFYGPLVRINETYKARFSHKQTFDMSQIGLGNMVSKMTLCSGNFMGRENVGIMGDQSIFILPTMTNRYSVAAITDGMGNKTRFEYDYLTTFGSEIYQWSKYWDDPEHDIFSTPFSMKALKRVSCSNPLAGTPVASTVYGYKDAYVHRKGKGVLGFRSVVSKSYINGQRFDSVVSNYSTTPLMAHRALSLTDRNVYNAMGRRVAKEQFENGFMEYYFNRKVYVPIVTRKWTLAFNPDNSEEEALSIAITENHYQINEPSTGNGSAGQYHIAVKLTDTYEGISPHWITQATDGQHITHTQTFYRPDLYLSDWIINRPDSTMVKAWKSGDPDISQSLIVYHYMSNTSYLVEKVVSYPGGNRNNANGLATSTSYKYDIVGNVTSETLASLNGFPAPRTTSYTYHGFMFPHSEANPMGYVTETQFEQQYGELQHSKDCNGQVTYYNRSNHLGSTEWVRYPDLTFGCTAKRWARHRPGFYDSDSPNGAAYYTWKRISGEAPVKVFFDAAGRELRTVTYGLHGDTIYQDTEYNNMGLVKRKSLPYFHNEPKQWTSYYYDGLLRPQDTYYPDGTHSSMHYDGFTTTSTFHTTDDRTRTTSETTNYLGQKTKSVDAAGTEVTYGYYSDGKLKWTQVGGNPDTQITLEYDDAGNRTMIHDPNYGAVKETYDAFGQLRTSLSPKHDLTRYEYDIMGRCINRVEIDENHQTTVETDWTYLETTGQKGLLRQITYGDNQTITYNYDGSHLNRLASKTERLFGTDYHTSYTYDDASGFPLRVKSVTYPTGYETRNMYDPATGQCHKIVDTQGSALWETLEKNAMGQITRFATGNGVQSRRYHYAATGRLQGISSWTSQNSVQNLGYMYDDFGNLAVRYDKKKDLREDFTYDELDRLTDVWLNETLTGVMAYDMLGRMTSKRADGKAVFSSAQYDYVGADGQLRPHAVSSAQTGDGFTQQGVQSIDYTMFDKVRGITTHTGRMAGYEYGYDHQRIRQVTSQLMWTKVKTYIGNCERIDEASKSTVYRTYLSGPLGVFAVVEEENGEESVYYVLKDHLGSWTTVTDANGDLVQEQSFDAWGTMRDPDTWTGTVAQQPMFDRGYTGHEHLNDFGLINMNGRMYDPLMSTFLSVDSYVQAPDFSQNFNRYAYCLNNPLKYTDPSGESLLATLAVYAVISATVSMVSTATMNFMYDRPLYEGLGRAALVGAAQGVFSFGIGSAAGAIGAAVASATNSAAWGTAAQVGFQVLAHGTLAGAASEFRKEGTFWSGFASGAAASLVSSATAGICVKLGASEAWTKAAMIAAGGLSGGVSSSMAGGEFIDGLCNGLICAGLNHALHYAAGDDRPYRRKLANYSSKYTHVRQGNALSVIDNEGTCKAASMSSVLGYFGINKNEISCYALFESMHSVDKNIGMGEYINGCGLNYITCNADGSSFSITNIGDYLEQGYPCVFIVDNGDGGYHSVVLLGLYRSDSSLPMQYYVSDPMNVSPVMVPDKHYTIHEAYVVTGKK
ncbi:MAG: VCBS repeat-containing protein [Bacteroidales bacterium]|nr:VCBS repeat-containing protein [Bacteroidales bacterium]